MLNYIKLKHILLKNFRNETTHIIEKGAITTRVILDKVKIIIDNQKIMLSDGNNENVIIDLNYVEKIKILNNWHINLKFKEFEISIQQ